MDGNTVIQILIFGAIVLVVIAVFPWIIDTPNTDSVSNRQSELDYRYKLASLDLKAKEHVESVLRASNTKQPYPQGCN